MYAIETRVEIGFVNFLELYLTLPYKVERGLGLHDLLTELVIPNQLIIPSILVLDNVQLSSLLVTLN